MHEEDQVNAQLTDRQCGEQQGNALRPQASLPDTRNETSFNTTDSPNPAAYFQRLLRRSMPSLDAWLPVNRFVHVNASRYTMVNIPNRTM